MALAKLEISLYLQVNSLERKANTFCECTKHLYKGLVNRSCKENSLFEVMGVVLTTVIFLSRQPATQVCYCYFQTASRCF